MRGNNEEGVQMFAPRESRQLLLATRSMTRHDVLFYRVDRPREEFYPHRPRSCRHRRPKRGLHQFVSHLAKEEGIGLGEVLRGMTMQLLWHAVALFEGGFVRDYFTMIAAPIQCDVMEYRSGRITHDYSGRRRRANRRSVR